VDPRFLPYATAYPPAANRVNVADGAAVAPTAGAR